MGKPAPRSSQQLLLLFMCAAAAKFLADVATVEATRAGYITNPRFAEVHTTAGAATISALLDDGLTPGNHGRSLSASTDDTWKQCNTILHDGLTFKCPASHKRGTNNRCVWTHELADDQPCAVKDAPDDDSAPLHEDALMITCTAEDLTKWGVEVATKYIKIMKTPLAEKLKIGTKGEFCKPIDKFPGAPAPGEASGLTFKFPSGLTALSVVGHVEGAVDYGLYVDAIPADPQSNEVIAQQAAFADTYSKNGTTERDATRWARYHHMFFFPTPVKEVTISFVGEPNSGVKKHPDDWVPHVTLDSFMFFFPGNAVPEVPPAPTGDAARRRQRRMLADDDRMGCFTASSVKTRGVGVPVSYCPSGERDGALCYPACKDGYYGVGPVCWAHCTDGYTDTGTGCQMWADSIGKDCCCIKKPCCFACAWNCDNGCCGCSQYGAEYTDTGCTCYRAPKYYIKDTYGRTAGDPMSCQPGQDYDAGLCYNQCPDASFDGIGPLCWKTECINPLFPHQCGRGVCTTDATSCGVYIAGVGMSAAVIFTGVAVCIFSAGALCEASLTAIEVGGGLAADVTEAVHGYCDP